MAKLRFNGNLSEAAGKVGRLQYRRSSVGQQITERGHSVPAASPARLAANARLERASDAWSLLSAEDKALWTQAAKGETRRDPVTLKVYSVTNRAHFIGLSAKFLQINGLGAAIPSAPPVLKFSGDPISVTAQVSGGVATWVGSGPNVAAKTELLAQRLASKDRAPGEEGYASQGFVAFATEDGNTASVTLGPGVWSLAYRFVSPATGEERAIVPLGTFVLGLAVVQGGVPDGTGERKAA